jgi:hypothetical protein
MLLWLSHSIEQRLDLEAIQFWASQDYSNGPGSIKLRAMACQNSLVPLHILNNAQIADVVGNLLYERRGIIPQPVGNVFPISQSDMLTHYSLHYWTGTFLSRDILLPPMSDDLSSGAVATPLSMVISLFTHQPPLMNLPANVSRIVEYALSIAKNRGLLTNTITNKPSSAPGNVTGHRAQPKQLTLNDLIPRRTQDVSLLQASNPLASAVVISDKQARQVYFAIDGQRNIAEISKMVPLEQEKFTTALLFLLKQNLICLYEAEGQPVDSSLFMKSL